MVTLRAERGQPSGVGTVKRNLVIAEGRGGRVGALVVPALARGQGAAFVVHG
jgi:hypothetical protein